MTSVSGDQEMAVQASSSVDHLVGDGQITADSENDSSHQSEELIKCNVDSAQESQSSDSGLASSDESIAENKSRESEELTEEKSGDVDAENAEIQLDKTKEVDIDDDDTEVALGDLTQLDSEGRNGLFGKGLTYDKSGKKNCALKCYIACLKDLQPDSKFPLLPQCLRNIADIFYQKDELEKAVHFIQAEKVYYESALIDTEDIHMRLEEAKKIAESEGNQSNQTMDTVRADEYEHLAKLCLDKDQPQLALEYAGKATKIRQELLGDSHPVTVKSLDFFASVYAKVGQEQYQESLQRLNSSSPDGEENEEETNDSASPVSILRKRKTGDKEEKKVRFHESQVRNHEQDQATDDMLAKNVLWALLVICCLLLVILAGYLHCKLNGQSTTCSNLKTNMYYGFMRMRYLYYHYTSPSEGAKYS